MSKERAVVILLTLTICLYLVSTYFFTKKEYRLRQEIATLENTLLDTDIKQEETLEILKSIMLNGPKVYADIDRKLNCPTLILRLRDASA